MVPTLYDRQAIRLDIRSLGLTSIRIQVCDFKVFCGSCELSVRRLHLTTYNRQIVWVLYGQASRAISTG